MLRNGSSTICSDDNAPDVSTAPTTPDGSLTLSPILLPTRLQHALEDATIGGKNHKRSRDSLDTSSFSRLDARNVCCIGAGYVGGPTAAVMAFQNPHLNVTVVDRDVNRIRQWKSKHLPIYEPGLSPILRIARDGSKACSFMNEVIQISSLDNVSSSSSASSDCESQCEEHREEIHIAPRSPNLFFSTEISKSISKADVILIAVNTPTKSRGLGAGRATDMTAVEAIAKEIAIYARAGAILVEKSTVPCRTVELIQDILKSNRPNTHFEILSNPEFLAAGTAINNLLTPDRIVIGSALTPSGHRAAQLLASIYASWVPRSQIITMNIYSSELTKLVANAMLAQRISSINSISAICEVTGADVDEVAKGIGMDARIGSRYLKAGLGFGGSCFKKDILSLCYLADSLGLEEVSEYWGQVLEMNGFQRRRFVRRVVKRLNGTLVGKKLAVLGYAFKQDTSDTRESPALECIKELLEDAPLEIAVFDPCCNAAVIADEIARLLGKDVVRENGGPIVVYNDAFAACAESHAVLIMTECDYFRSSSSSTPGNSPYLGSKSFQKSESIVDPRPFQRLELTESEILTLSNYFSSTFGSHDPLHRFEEEPECEDGCVKCCEGESTVKGLAAKGRENGQLDWTRIAYHLKKPKWVFDARGVVDGGEMEGLGVRLESVGRGARWHSGDFSSRG